MSELITASNDNSFFAILGHAFRIVKQHWRAFLIFLIVTFITLTIFIIAMGSVGFGFLAMGSGAAVLIVTMVILLFFMVAMMFISLSSLKVIHLAISNQAVTLGEVVSYGGKNVLSFIWAIIAGTVYALRWGLLLVLGVPALYAIMNVFATQSALKIASTTETGNIPPEAFSSGALSMMSSVRFALSMVGLVAAIWMLLAFVKIIFLGYAFVADEKRGIEAAKASMEVVKGRWGKTFGYFFSLSLLLTIGLVLIGSIIEAAVGPDIRAISDSILSQFATIIIMTFSALVYGVWKKTSVV